ncbi:hypothetical protein PSDVSF_03340 [Pseudodesulfovibrio sediminis]|uniref:Uncharacterized protein n=1 Tax=Pseudodesulfovibrio sediminis TaxID=2810563 RepID=A0ABM7P2H7_9BACT|nr:hypothetical protein PSDVSF_03340 [Pseudodesulfovibrio sediminis]
MPQSIIQREIRATRYTGYGVDSLSLQQFDNDFSSIEFHGEPPVLCRSIRWGTKKNPRRYAPTGVEFSVKAIPLWRVPANTTYYYVYYDDYANYG